MSCFRCNHLSMREQSNVTTSLKENWMDHTYKDLAGMEINLQRDIKRYKFISGGFNYSCYGQHSFAKWKIMICIAKNYR